MESLGLHNSVFLPKLVKAILMVLWKKLLFKTKTLLVIFFIILVIGYMLRPDPSGWLTSVTKRVVHLGSAEVHIMEGGDVRLKVKNDKRTLLTVNIGYFLPGTFPQIFTYYGKSLSFSWPEGLQLDITQEDLRNGNRFNVSWAISNSEYNILKDVVSLDKFHWYGGTHIGKFLWPIEKWDTELVSYTTGDPTQGEFGNIQERYWLSSAGVALVVQNDDPLFVRFNSQERTMTFVSRWTFPYRNHKKGPLRLSYSIYQAKDVLAVHKMTTNLVFKRPKMIPDTFIFGYPIWSTWVVHKWFVNQDKVVRFAQDIYNYGFNASQIEIDDDWTSAYGDLDFDPIKFPDPAAMVQAVHKYNFRMSLWVPPFCSLKSEACALPDIWVKGYPTGIVHWWDAYGRLLDVTNPLAERWLMKQLYKIRLKYKFTTFKFDAGEAAYLPRGYETFQRLNYPNEYTKYYGEMAAKIDGNFRAAEIRSATGLQHLPLFIRFMDKDSNWGYENGLKTIIPHAIQLGLLGYFFFIPDIICGNEYALTRAPKELFIRWVQLSALLPVMQFSRPPWHFDNETVQIAKEMTRLHLEYSDYIIQLANEAVVTGDPIIRPLWWYSPLDDTALQIDSEFLLGDSILVAPVLEPDARSRDIYLPKGRWHRNGKTYTGPGWLRDYAANLADLVYFHRQGPVS